MNERLRQAVESLRAAGIDSPRSEVRLLWAHAETRAADFDSLLDRRMAREPVAYILGHKEFWSLEFEVGPGVLIPRPETETLVEQALRCLPDRTTPYRILDLGTGSACLLVALLNEFPNANGWGVDISEEALRYARTNVARHGVAERAALVQGNWDALQGSFDLIVSNPPYIPSADIAKLERDVRDYEPLGALDGGIEGFHAYRGLACLLPRLLSAGGGALLEIGAGQHHMVREIVEDHGLRISTVVPDLSGTPRCLVIGPGKTAAP